MSDESKTYKHDYNDEEILKLIRDIKDDFFADSAFKKLVDIFHPLYCSIANVFTNQLSASDSMFVKTNAQTALYKAVQNFDVDNKKTKFSTYLYPYMKGAILEAINDLRGGVSMSKDFERFALKVRKVRNELEQELRRVPTSEEIKYYLDEDNVTVDKINLAIASLQSVDSLSNKNDENEKSRIKQEALEAEILKNNKSDTSSDDIEQLLYYVNNSDLTDKEIIIVNYKHGLIGEQKKNKEIAKELHISESRVMQLYNRALIKIKIHTVEDGLAEPPRKK